ncbi:MAG TPA: ABC transporter substrate-binding protein [Candidatus Binatia bacterium]|jgi:putative ABC transport system substrate-binding protein|nr:ABC transporter substrate-binding protein [Candidatus Binatia bacterium]
MNGKVFVWLLITVLLATVSPAQAQQPQKNPRIGFLSATSPSTIPARLDAFRQGLRDFGYVEGKNIVIEYRYADGKLDRVPALATELVRLNVDVIVTGGSAATRPAKEATTTIPIVMAQDTDPIGNEFVASLGWPGGNVTGLSIVAPELSGKQLELLKESIPKLLRVVVPSNPNEPSYMQLRKETELAAKALKIQIQFLDARSPKDVETAFREATKRRADAVLVPTMPIVASQRAQIADLAVKNRLPAMYGQPEYVDAGGLMFYGASITDLFRRAATYVDKILKGAKPAELPVEQPTKFEFIINLKAAKQIGLTIPPNVLARADRVIR